MVCKIEDDSVFADTPKKKNQIQRRWRITAFGHVHQGQVYWGEWGDRGTLLVDDWKYLDIIRRHVAPVAPDPGLRDVAAKRMYEETAGYLERTSMTGGSIPWEDSYERDLYRNRVDIVLAVLAERGVR